MESITTIVYGETRKTIIGLFNHLIVRSKRRNFDTVLYKTLSDQLFRPSGVDTLVKKSK